MLPATARMRSAQEFRRTIRSGVRAGRSTVVVHMHRTLGADGTTEASVPPHRRTRVGFVVSKAVGNAVTRNRVKRRLRHLSMPLLARCPLDTRVVVRALPPAAAASDLGDDLEAAWGACLHKLSRRTGSGVRS